MVLGLLLRPLGYGSSAGGGELRERVFRRSADGNDHVDRGEDRRREPVGVNRHEHALANLLRGVTPMRVQQMMCFVHHQPVRPAVRNRIA